MAGHSIPVDFVVDSQKIRNPVERKTLLQELLPLIEPYTGTLKQISSSELPDGSFFELFASEKVSFSAKLYSSGLVSCMVEYYTKDLLKQRITNDDGRKLEKLLLEKLKAKRAKVLVAIKRAPEVNPYFTASDDRIFEYDVTGILHDERTEFQHVQVFSTKSFGNMLVLDSLQNLAESDLEYTRGLMNHPKEDYKDKQVLILGGGDGALLWELLKEKPAFVTMIDIDDVVMKACRKHMKSACGTCLDNYDGDNYKVIVGDALAYMKDYIKEGRKFDYVFGDLTDVPVSPTPRGELWDFMRSIMSMATKLLKPASGKYMTHAISSTCEEALKMFHEQLQLFPVTVTQTQRPVPSFLETWCFFQATSKATSL